MNRSVVKGQLIRDEGMKLHPYKDTVGKLTIGVGRNLDDVGISEAEAGVLLDNDLARVEAALRNALSWFYALDEPRQHVLVNMAFNLGVPGLLAFQRMLAAIQARDYDTAGDEMLNSKWAGQVGARAQRLAKAMRTGGES